MTEQNTYEKAFIDLVRKVTRLNDFNEAPVKVSKKRQDILRAAKSLFAEKGFAATTTAEIARVAQTTEKTLFKHFPKKNDLVLAVSLETISENFKGTYLSRYLLRDDLETALGDFLIDKQEAWMTDPDGLVLFFQIILLDQTIRRELLGVMSKVSASAIADPVMAIGEKFGDENFDVNLFMIVLFGTMMAYGLTRTALFPGWETDDRANLRKITEMLLHGIDKKKEQA